MQALSLGESGSMGQCELPSGENSPRGMRMRPVPWPAVDKCRTDHYCLTDCDNL